jgi:intein/homing endonuclease
VLKVSHFQGQSDYGVTAIPLFGKADKEFEKHASSGLLPDVVRYIGALRPSQSSQYVLVNAMGAGEWYGSNVNGDNFPEAGLIHMPPNWTGVPVIDMVVAKNWAYGFPTFYNAHPYAHHRNKDPGRAFGNVELATWNPLMRRVELVVRVDQDKCMRYGGEGVWDKLRLGQHPDVSMGTRVPYDTCFPAGTLVRTAEGHKAIEDLQRGEFVLTHTGKLLQVTDTMRRETQDLLRVRCSGLPDIDVTDNHEFLVLRKEQARTCKGSANGQRVRHTFRDESSTCSRCGRTQEYELDWAAVETLKPGDYVAVPAHRNSGSFEVSPIRARVAGYYLGDGYILKQRTGKKKDGDYRDMGVGFSVGTVEEAHLQRLLSALSELGSKNEALVYDAGCGRKAHIVSLFDQGLAAWLQQTVGRTSHGKRISSEVYCWNEEARLELVAGYIDTDGSFDLASGQLRVASVNRGLLLDVQRLLLSLRITATVCYGGSSTGFSETPVVCWYLVLSGAQAQRFLGRSVKVQKREVSWESPQSFFWGDYWLTPVKAIEELDKETSVFNISVDQDESYVAEGRVVHNCSICLDWDLYKDVQSRPGSEASPGRKILEFHKQKKSKDGVGIRGLSVTRKDYCEHAKNQMNKILPDGRKVWVYNDYPRFFDISFVYIGADKTAKVMLFVFHNGQAHSVKSSAEVAEAMGTKEPDEKIASVPDELLKSAFGKLARPKKAEIDKNTVPSQFAGKAVPLLTGGEPDVPRETLDGLGALPIKDVLSTLTGMGIVLKPREFQRITLVHLENRDLADELDDKNEVFPRSGETRCMDLDKDSYRPGLARLLQSLMFARSGLGPLVEKRVLVSTGGFEKKEASVPSHHGELLAKIGSAYNGYRQSVMTLVAHTQDLLAASGTSPELSKLACASPEQIFTPLSVAYLQCAHLDGFGVPSNGVVKLSTDVSQRGEGSPLEEHVAN